MKKVIFDVIHAPGITRHSVVGYLVDREETSIDDAINQIRKYEDLKSDDKLFLYATDAEITVSSNDDDEHIEINFKTIMTGNYNSRWVLVTESLLKNMYPVDYDGDTLNVSNVEEVLSGLPALQPYERHYTGSGTYNVRNKWMHSMAENVFDRTKLTSLFDALIASNSKAFDALEDAIAGKDDHTVGDFRVWRDADEDFFMLHIPSGTIVGWYKFYHFGRANFSNREMSMDDLEDFFNLLRNQLLDEPDVPDEPREEPEYHPQVKVTEVDKSEVEKPTLTKADIEKAMHRLTINSIYGTHGLDPVSMYPMPPKSVDMENAWNVVKRWAKEHFHFSETNHIKCTVTSKSGKDNVWLIRHHDFIQLMGDTGDEIFIGYVRAEYSHKDEYGRRTCIQDQIRFENPIIDKFYQDFFANGPVREEYDFYKKTAGGW
jgi:hypothetical protein